MTKKFISLVLIAAMVFSMVPASVFAADTIDSYLEFENFPSGWINEHTEFSITAKDGVTAMSVNGTPVLETGGTPGGGVTPGSKPYVKYKALSYDEETGILEIGVFIGNITSGAGVFTVKYDNTNWGICDINSRHYGREFTTVNATHKFATCFMKPFDLEDDYYIDEEYPEDNINTYGLTSAQVAALDPDFLEVSLITGERAQGVDFENGVAFVTWQTSAKLVATQYEMPVLRFALINKSNATLNSTTITEPSFSELPGDPSVSDAASSTQMNINGTIYSTAKNNLDYVVETLDGTKYGCAQPVPGTFKYEGNTENALSYNVSITVNGTPYQKTYNVSYDDVYPTLEVAPVDTSAPAQSVKFTISASDDNSGLKGVTVNDAPLTSNEYTVTESGEYVFRAVDNAGNGTRVVRNVTIDTTPPALEITGNATEWTNEDVVLNINAEAGATVTVNGNAHTGATYTVTENGEYEFLATDIAGNTTYDTIVVDKIDKTAPSLTVTPETTEPTKEDVEIYFIASDTQSGTTVTVAKDGGNAEVVSGTTYAAEENGTYTFVATDGADNTKTQTVVIGNIDKIAPSLTVTPDKTTPTNEKVILTIELEAGAILTVSKDEGNEQVVSETTYDVTENGTYTFVATDAVGNKTTESVVVSNIDTVPPALEITGNATEWTNEDVVLNINAEAGATVTVNGNAHTGATYTVTENGEYKFVATDAAGNKTTKAIVVDKIDKISPTLEITGNATEWVTQDFVLTIVTEDGVTVTVNCTPITVTNGEATYTITENETYVFVATDAAGNTTTEVVVVDKLDKGAPLLSVSDAPIAVTKAHTFTYEASDAVSEIEKVTVSKDGGTEQEIEDGEYIATEDGEYTFTAYDNAGNKTVVTRTIAAGMIDRIAPELVISGYISADEWKNADVEMSVSANENVTVTVYRDGNEIGTLTVVANGSARYTATETGTYKFVAEDAAGNTAESDEYPTHIDKIKPTLELSFALPEGWCSPYTVSFDFGDEGGSGKDSFTLDGEDFMGTFEATENKDYVAVLTDKAGNVTTETVTISNVDVFEPEISNISELPTTWTSEYELTFTAIDVETDVYTVYVNGDYVRLESGVGSYTVTETGDYEIVVTDYASNTKTQTVTVDYIDNEAPTVTEPAVPTEPCQNFTFEITAEDSQSGVESVTVGGLPATKNGDVWTYYIEANGIYEIKATDKVGRVSESVFVEVDKIDNENPVITFPGFEDVWTNEDVVISISIDKEVESLTVEHDGSTETITGETSYTATENGIYTFTAEDAAGNVGTNHVIITKIDRANPEISVVGVPAGLVKNFVATITASDSETDVTVTVSKDGGAKQNVSGTTYPITADGEYVFTATDLAGNFKSYTLTVDNIDTEAPVLEVGSESGYAISIELPVSVTDNKSTDITVTVNDEPFNGTSYIVTENRTYTFKAVDEAGNETTVVRTINKIDRVGPVVTTNSAPSDWVNSFTLSINAQDSGSGVATIKVNGTPIDGTTYDVPANGVYTVVAVDALGNESEEEIVTVEKLDKALPEIEVSEAPSAWTREHTFTITAFDALSDVKEITVNGIKVEGSTYTVSANGEYKFVVLDNAGNKAEQIVNVTKIDTAAPVFGGGMAASEVLTDSIKVTLPTATDDSGEAVTYELYLNDTKVEGFTGGTEYTFTGLTKATTYTIKLVAADVVSRTTEISANYSTLDLGRIEATVDVSGFANKDALHMSMVVNGVTLPVGNDGKVVFTNLAEGTYTATFKAAGFFEIAKAELVVSDGALTTLNIAKAELVAGDTTADGVIDIYDLNAVASAFAESYDGETGLIYDFNRDGKVNAEDIRILVANYNKVQ